MTPNKRPQVPVPLTQRRRQRVSAEEVRERMLEEAHRVVTILGVTASLEDLSMEDVIKAAGVPRASVYRIWPYRGDFIADLLEHMAGPDWFGSGSYDVETLKVAAKTVLAHKDRMTTLAGRRAVACEAIRVAAERNYDYVASDPNWKIYIALIATSGGARDPATRARVATALAESDGRFTANMATFYGLMGGLMGFRPRASYTFEHLAVAGAAIVEGLALRRILVATAEAADGDDPRTRLAALVTERVSGPGLDGDADWSLAALGFLGVFDALVEPVPDGEYDPNAIQQLDLTTALAFLREAELI
jgi:AcrR family transcriptional regulator